MKCHLSKQSRVFAKPPNVRAAFSAYLCNVLQQKGILTNISLRQLHEMRNFFFKFSSAAVNIKKMSSSFGVESGGVGGGNDEKTTVAFINKANQRDCNVNTSILSSFFFRKGGKL